LFLDFTFFPLFFLAFSIILALVFVSIVSLINYSDTLLKVNKYPARLTFFGYLVALTFFLLFLYFLILKKNLIIIIFLFLIFFLFFAKNITVDFWLILMFSIFANLGFLLVQDFLFFYIFLEFVSLTFYTLASLNKKSILAAEAAIKYFVFGSIASVFFLISISCFYGLFGTISWNDLSLFLLFSLNFTNFKNLLLLFAAFFFLIGFLIKLGLFPFYSWVPDVFFF